MSNRTKDQAHTFEEAFNNSKIRFYNLDKKENRLLKQPERTISLMTIHKSKGLEFPNVFVSGVCSGLLPHYKSKREDWDEELRLLYVAMTRAKNWLCLSSYEEDAQYPRGKSPFLQYIPATFLEAPVERLENIPPRPEEMIVPVGNEETAEYVEPLPEKLLGDGMTVLGIDPGNIGAKTTNVGWSITQKSPHGYSVLDFGTERPIGTPEDKLEQIERKIKTLIQSSSNRPHAIAVEKLEVATEEARKEWFLYVAACVASVRSIADKEGIECRLYTPQHVKYAATDNRQASKEDVQKAVKRMCNLQQIPEPHHSADAIATSLCYLRNYLNSSRFEGNKRKQEHYEAGCDYLDRKQYKTAIDKFKETINIDPVYTEAHCGLGRVYLAQNDWGGARTAAKTALRLTENNHPDSQKLLDAIEHYHSGCNFLNNSEWNMAIDKFQESINLEPIFTDAHCGLSRAYIEVDNLEVAKGAAEEALRLIDEYSPAQKLLVKIKRKYYYRGIRYFNNEQYNQAITEFQEALKIDRKFKGAHLTVGEAYLKLEELKKAEKSAREALRIYPNYELAQGLLEKIKQKHKEHGDDYRKKKAFTKALKSYQQAIRIDNKYKEAYHNLGILYRRMKKYDEAIEAYQKAIDIDERSHVTYSDLSFVYREIGETAKAVDLLKRAITIKPDYQRAYYNLADTYFEMENLQDASKTVLVALRLDANNQDTLKLLKNIVHAHLKQGHDYFRRSDLTAAEFSAKAVLELDSNNQPAHKLMDDIKQTYYKRGLTSFKQKEWKAAEKSAEEALKIDRNYKHASILLKDAYCQQALDHEKSERYCSSINLLKKAIDIDPICKKTYYYLGRTYFKLDRLKEARMMVEKALSIQPNYRPSQKLQKEIKDARNWLKLGGKQVRRLVSRIAKRIGF